MKYLAVILALVLSTPAMAQTTCAPISAVMETLKSRYGEVPQATGLVSSGTLAITFANPAKGNWTLVLVSPDGKACLVAAGENFEIAPQGDPA